MTLTSKRGFVFRIYIEYWPHHSITYNTWQMETFDSCSCPFILVISGFFLSSFIFSTKSAPTISGPLMQNLHRDSKPLFFHYFLKLRTSQGRLPVLTLVVQCKLCVFFHRYMSILLHCKHCASISLSSGRQTMTLLASQGTTKSESTRKGIPLICRTIRLCQVTLIVRCWADKVLLVFLVAFSFVLRGCVWYMIELVYI